MKKVLLVLMLVLSTMSLGFEKETIKNLNDMGFKYSTDEEVEILSFSISKRFMSIYSYKEGGLVNKQQFDDMSVNRFYEFNKNSETMSMNISNVNGNEVLQMLITIGGNYYIVNSKESDIELIKSGLLGVMMDLKFKEISQENLNKIIQDFKNGSNYL